MRKILAISALALTSMFFTGSAFAQETAPAPEAAPPPAPATESGATTSADADEKKIGLGLDAQFMLPVGDLSDATGPLIGPVIRFGYRVMPPLEVTGRIGYLFGMKKELDLGIAKVDMGLNVIPIWVGARYFFMEPQAGLYGAAEIGANIMSPSVSGGGPAPDSLTRFGFNVGAGYVISKELPIDIRAQLTHLNLLGTETGETAALAIGISAGYGFQF